MAARGVPVKALYTFEAAKFFANEELSFTQGSQLMLMEVDATAGWGRGYVLEGDTMAPVDVMADCCWFPLSFVEILKDSRKVAYEKQGIGG